jgi:hypothetical protein
VREADAVPIAPGAGRVDLDAERGDPAAAEIELDFFHIDIDA